MSESVLLSRREGAVALFTMNRPAARNALDRALVDALGEALERASDDAGVRVIVLTGAGGAFCAGADLKKGLAEDPELLSDVGARVDRFHRLIRAIAGADKPVIAGVDGAAVGFGCDLALACDLRVVTARAYFQEKFVKIGLMPDGGGTFFLPRLVGTARALELMLTGEAVEGERAVSLGIANRLAEPPALEAECLGLARSLAAGPPLAFAQIKRAVYASATGTIDDALARERAGQTLCLTSRDAMEGIMAWMEKREPSFEGH